MARETFASGVLRGIDADGPAAASPSPLSAGEQEAARQEARAYAERQQEKIDELLRAGLSDAEIMAELRKIRDNGRAAPFSAPPMGGPAQAPPSPSRRPPGARGAGAGGGRSHMQRMQAMSRFDDGSADRTAPLRPQPSDPRFRSSRPQNTARSPTSEGAQGPKFFAKPEEVETGTGRGSGERANGSRGPARRAGGRVVDAPAAPPSADDANVDWAGIRSRPTGRRRRPHRAQKDSVSFLFAGTGEVDEAPLVNNPRKKHPYQKDPRFQSLEPTTVKIGARELPALGASGPETAQPGSTTAGSRSGAAARAGGSAASFLSAGGMAQNGASSWKTSYQSQIDGERAEVDKHGRPVGRRTLSTYGVPVGRRKRVEPAWAHQHGQREWLPPAARGTGQRGVGGGGDLLASGDILSKVVSATGSVGLGRRRRGAGSAHEYRQDVDAAMALRKVDDGMLMENYRSGRMGMMGNRGV